MPMQLTHVNVWVHDQDEALDFYTQKLGMELRDDITLPEMGGFRWLTVGSVGQPDVALALMPVPGPAGVRCRRRPSSSSRCVAKGAAGGLFFTTDDVHGDLRGAQEPRRGVHRRNRWSGPTASMPGSATSRATRCASRR